MPLPSASSCWASRSQDCYTAGLNRSEKKKSPLQKQKSPLGSRDRRDPFDVAALIASVKEMGREQGGQVDMRWGLVGSGMREWRKGGGTEGAEGVKRT